MKHSCLVSIVLVLFMPGVAHAAIPKMLSESAWPDKALGPPVVVASELHSNSTTFLGDCDPTTPFVFKLYGPAGVGAIGVSYANQGQDIAIEVVQVPGVEITLGSAEQRFFEFDNNAADDVSMSDQDDDAMWGYPLEYSVNDPILDGVSATLKCTIATPVIIIMNDDINLDIQAVATETQQGDELLELLGGVTANEKLQGSTRRKKNSDTASPVSFNAATNKNIRIKHEQGNTNKGIALIDGIFTSLEGYKVKRTLIRESKPKPTSRQQRKVPVKCCEITDEGDVEISFPGMFQRTDERLRVDVRVGIELAGSGSSTPPLEIVVVDVTSILSGQQGQGIMTVHGGWIRNAIDDANLEGTTEGWDIVILDAVISDPNDEYRVVGVMDKNDKNNKNNASQVAAKRAKLSRKPSDEEVNVSDEMKKGRKPTREQRERQLGHPNRRLSGGHKKILVHGYCASANPFPKSHFTNYVEFVDGGSPASWSHDDFANKIDSFADSQGLHGCGCIAHSQGGAACLHLYSYYWSCLDYPINPGRMIQSVGTPYRGSALAGSIAALGDIFGAGCGSNYDMTESGADNWLSNIPSWARSKVTYHTTSFEDKWWRWDYCHVASDLILSDPEDGTTEKGRGTLSGGVNGGHKTKQCHTTGMRDPPQCQDSSRNSVMNSNAQY